MKVLNLNMKVFKYCLFYIFAAFIAPTHFKPRRCYVIDKSKCRIWNCHYHYKDNRYSDCQKNVPNKN